MSLDLEFEVPIAAGVCNELGEGILWDDRTGQFVWIDIQGSALFRLDFDSRKTTKTDLPFRPGSLALTDDPVRLVIAFDSGFAIFHRTSGSIEWLYRPELAPGVRFNDGRVDPAGRFVAGTMVEDVRLAGGNDLGRVFRLEGAGQAITLLDGIHITNSLCWSPDGKWMYHSDTPTGKLMRYRYSDSHAVADGILATFKRGALPDGACCDAVGNVWVALWGGSRVECYSPLGERISSIDVPPQQPSCVAFGGPDLDWLAVTSAWEGLKAPKDRQPSGAGDMFLIKTNAKGRIEKRVELSTLKSAFYPK